MPVAAGDASIRGGNVLLARVKSNASGRPGPRRVTGDYTRTINLRAQRGDDTEVVVGTNAAQALRLEFGFHGTDSLGRRYNQPPYPHWRPAYEATAPQIVAAVREAVAKAIA